MYCIFVVTMMYFLHLNLGEKTGTACISKARLQWNPSIVGNEILSFMGRRVLIPGVKILTVHLGLSKVTFIEGVSSHQGWPLLGVPLYHKSTIISVSLYFCLFGR